MDLFQNLDDFLNKDDSFPSPSSFKPNENNIVDDVGDVADVEFRDLTTESKPVPKQSSKPKFVPAKGQKMAAKRLNKIKDFIANELDEQTASALVTKTQTKPSEAVSQPLPKTNNRVNKRQNRVRELFSRYQTNINEHSNVICLDPDYEHDLSNIEVEINRNLTQQPLSADLRNENNELIVYVKIHGEVIEFSMRRFQKFTELIDQIAAKQSLNRDCIVLTLKGNVIAETETPSSIELVQGFVLEVHVIESGNNIKESAELSRRKADSIEIKIQTATRKRPFTAYIGKNEQLKVLFFQCAEEFKCDLDKVKLEFDGDMIDASKMAKDLDLEGGEVMDLFII